MITFAEASKGSFNMEKLATKLNLRDNSRICILNADNKVVTALTDLREGLVIDYSIDPRFLYNFFLIFVTRPDDIDDLAHRAVHNLYDDGILWFAYPRPGEETARDRNIITRDNGWEPLKKMGLKGVTNIIIDERWNGIRFRNSKYVRSRYGNLKEG
ncbi:MAG: hypothetical protein LC649_05410 [Bacteroidales bacterium]|nr:hypothetical protein [Bacteroidales bacterium]